MESAPPIEPYRYGLLSIAQIQSGPGTWQASGVEYFSDACAQGGFVVGSCPAPLPTTEQTADVTATPGDASGDGVTLTAPAANDFAVQYALVPEAGGAVFTGTLAPNQTVTLDVPDGTYTLQAQAAGQPLVTAADDVVTPAGDPVTAEVTIAASGPGASHDKPLAEGLNLVTGSPPFTVYARAECNAVGFEDPQGTARRRLALIENRETERNFSQYVLGAVGARLPAGAGAVTLKRGLGLLETDAALYYGGTPTLHSPRWTNPYFADRSLIQANSGTQPVLRTRLDARVAFGGGYYDNPFAPAAPVADQFWLVATGSVRAFRSEVFVNETFTPVTNIRLAVAERTYALDADCYRAAVLITLAGED